MVMGRRMERLEGGVGDCLTRGARFHRLQCKGQNRIPKQQADLRKVLGELERGLGMRSRGFGMEMEKLTS